MDCETWWDMSLSGLVRKNALKHALEAQRTTIFQRIEPRQARKAWNKPQTDPEGPKLTEIQLYSDIGSVVENSSPQVSR